MTDQAMPATDTALPAICRNCQRPLTGAWCSGCGQRHSARVLTLRELFSDVISEFLTWDSKMMRSVRPLLFRPGFLTNEYLAGRRTRYILPTRLYIIISVVVFFLLLGLGPVLPSALGPERLAELARQHGTTALEVGDRLNDKFRAILPWMLVVSMPLFALVLKALYWRSKRVYVENLLFSVHLFAFSLLALVGLAFSLFLGELGLLLMFGIFFLYLTLAVRRVYKQGWWKTILKSILLGLAFFNLFYLTIYVSLALAERLL